MLYNHRDRHEHWVTHWDRAPNATMNVPTPAVHVTVVSPVGIPCNKFTVPYGIPVDVLNAVQMYNSIQVYQCMHIISIFTHKYMSIKTQTY